MTAAPVESDSHGPERLSAADLIVLSDEIAALVRAGIPLDIGLRGTASRSSGALKRLAGRVAERIDRGDSLSAALKAEEPNVPPGFRVLIAAGERSGRLADVLEGLAEHAALIDELRCRVRNALIYPSCVVLLAVLLMSVFLWEFLPEVEQTYRALELDAHSPMPLSIAPVTLAWLVVSTVLLVAVVIVWLIVRPIREDFCRSRFARLAALLVTYRVPLPEALTLSGDACGSSRLKNTAREVARHVERGRSLSDVPGAVMGFPPFMRWLLAAGERENSLGTSLRQAAEVYGERARSRSEFTYRFVPAVLLFFVGGSVTFLYAWLLFWPVSRLLTHLALP